MYLHLVCWVSVLHPPSGIVVGKRVRGGVVSAVLFGVLAVCWAAQASTNGVNSVCVRPYMRTHEPTTTTGLHCTTRRSLRRPRVHMRRSQGDYQRGSAQLTTSKAGRTVLN